LTSILRAHTMCDMLYVIVSEREHDDGILCRTGKVPYISGALRKKWLCQELQDIENVKILLLNEEAYNIPSWPHGWKDWAMAIRSLVPNFNIIFGGEVGYTEGSNTYFPDKKYVIIDSDRSRWPVSGTAIRANPYKYWDYIIGAARPFFAKKILITGTESCGKTTITKKLAKIFYTSWSEELGRHYSKRYLGGDESTFTDEDFFRIAHLQYEQDYEALYKANKVCFFDTDAVVTSYYAKIYLGHDVEGVRKYIDPSRYDLVIIMRPDVKWIDDGLRFLGEDKKRWELHESLIKMYLNNGFDTAKMMEVGGTYEERLDYILNKIDSMIK